MEGSESFADYREQLLSWEQCQQSLQSYCEELDFPSEAEEFVASLKTQLSELSHSVDKLCQQGDFITINEDGEPVLKKIQAKTHSTEAAALEAAIRDIINSYNRFNLPKIWGTGKRAAADGTKFNIYENNLVAEYHIRYGGYGGIAYHHVADNYIALFTHFITCGVWEAVYILDGLLKNTSDIQPDTLHADTQGAECTAAC